MLLTGYFPVLSFKCKWELQVFPQNDGAESPHVPGLMFRVFLFTLCTAAYSRSSAQMKVYVLMWVTGRRLCSEEQFHTVQNFHSQ